MDGIARFVAALSCDPFFVFFWLRDCFDGGEFAVIFCRRIGGAAFGGVDLWGFFKDA